MTAIDNLRTRLRALPAFALAFSVTGVAAAAPCADLNPVNPIYGAGGSAVTATLGNIAIALAGLSGDDQVTIFYNDDGGACTGYQRFLDGASTDINYKYWTSSGGAPITCQAPASLTTFAHMGNTPLLCPANQPLPAGIGKFVAPVQTINLITDFDSEEESISAEALYHIFGFGPGASGRAVEPWVVPNSVFARRTSSFVHQIVAGAIGVPATSFKIPSTTPNNFLAENLETVLKVEEKGTSTTPDETLGYVSGSTAEQGEADEQIKTLAYQHFDQSCAYLPDTSRERRDRLNARTGQYYLWTPAWLYARVNGAGEVESAITKKLIGWFDGTLASPDGVDIQEIIIEAGDIPLCAMQAIRPEGDLSEIQSYAPEKPCNGYYEFVKTGETDYTACDSNDECAGFDEETGTTEICSLGFCELTYSSND